MLGALCNMLESLCWQMIWEQGSVVIVNLTRLTEEGVAMCHRYWPEEGSDLYHIYEVTASNKIGVKPPNMASI